MDSDSFFIDTSGLVAYLDGDDTYNERAVDAWEAMLAVEYNLIVTDYVRLETWALVQRRLGIEAIQALSKIVLPLCQVEYVGEEGFERASGQWLTAQRRNLSLVDIASFDCMRRKGIELAFAFDKHFEEQGFVSPVHPDWPARR